MKNILKITDTEIIYICSSSETVIEHTGVEIKEFEIEVICGGEIRQILSPQSFEIIDLRE